MYLSIAIRLQINTTVRQWIGKSARQQSSMVVNAYSIHVILIKNQAWCSARNQVLFCTSLVSTKTQQGMFWVTQNLSGYSRNIVQASEEYWSSSVTKSWATVTYAKAGNNAERQLCASTDFIALILNVLRIKERLQNDYICTLKM